MHSPQHMARDSSFPVKAQHVSCKYDITRWNIPYYHIALYVRSIYLYLYNYTLYIICKSQAHVRNSVQYTYTCTIIHYTHTHIYIYIYIYILHHKLTSRTTCCSVRSHILFWSTVCFIQPATSQPRHAKHAGKLGKLFECQPQNRVLIFL